MKRHIMAFGSRRRVGKDTAALAIVNSRGVSKLAFADDLKDKAYLIWGNYGLKPREHYDEFPEEREVIIPGIGLSARDLWVGLGEAAREVDPLVWVRPVEERSKDGNVVISDLRKYTEVDAIRRLGGCLVEVVRPGEEKFNDPVDSELEDFRGWHYQLVNDGDADSLRSKAVDLWDSWVSR